MIVLNLTGLGFLQETYCQNKLDSVQHYKLDLDSIGAALIKGLNIGNFITMNNCLQKF